MADPAALTFVMTLAEVLGLLRGRMGRTRLLQHLRAVPTFAGGPTHRRNGSKLLFTPADYNRLVESL